MSQKQLKPLSQNEETWLIKLTELEALARIKGFKRIAGVDEAGRGPLAGPVVAAAVCIPEGIFFPGINDSKLLVSGVRRALYKELTSRKEIQYSVALVSEQEIDAINILQASLKAMKIAVSQLIDPPDYILIDGTHAFSGEIAFETVVHGDQRSQSIAAASIIAKETRDELMLEYHEKYPEYGFDKHKGYGTEKHRAALIKYGPCPIHRRSFAPIRDCHSF